MPMQIDNKTYYTTGETCEKAGISRGTLFRWIKIGLIPEAQYRNRNGWRLFSDDEIKKMRNITEKTVKSK